MKQFLIKFLCFALAVLTLLFAAGSWYNHRSPVSDEMQVSIGDMPEKVELAVTGSSHALFGIKLGEYADNFFNFAMPGQTPRYDNAMLTEFEDRIAEDATVILDVSYMSPFWTEPQSEFLEKQTRYYRILSRENITDYDPKEAFRVRLNQAIPATRILYTDFFTLLQTLAVPAKAAEPQEQSHWYDNIPHQQEVLKKKHQGLISPVFPDMNPAMEQAYREILQKARAHNWRVIAVTTPFTESYNEIYDAEFYRVFYGHVETLFESQGIEYWDFSHDPRFAQARELFVDLDHLSPEGAREFSRILARELDLIP